MRERLRRRIRPDLELSHRGEGREDVICFEESGVDGEGHRMFTCGLQTEVDKHDFGSADILARFCVGFRACSSSDVASCIFGTI